MRFYGRTPDPESLEKTNALRRDDDLGAAREPEKTGQVYLNVNGCAIAVRPPR